MLNSFQMRKYIHVVELELLTEEGEWLKGKKIQVYKVIKL